ncbi:DUF3592 domain-containing protein [Streptomyces sp. NPDC026673]|uniref:DUF3592 domain-containing protein n=1 Tax=Streptomyces sp. NPDC026673 TaxID=3155724 RepID=UPI0033E92D59
MSRVHGVPGWNPKAFPNAGERDTESARDPRALLAVGALLLVVGAWVLATTVKQTVDQRHGVHTTGIIRTHVHGAGDDRLWVRFTAVNDEVTHRLPESTDPRGLDDGDRLAVVYEAGHPENVVAERDIGTKALLFSSGLAAVGLALVTGSGLTLHRAARRRKRVRTDPAV